MPRNTDFRTKNGATLKDRVLAFIREHGSVTIHMLHMHMPDQKTKNHIYERLSVLEAEGFIKKEGEKPNTVYTSAEYAEIGVQNKLEATRLVTGLLEKHAPSIIETIDNPTIMGEFAKKALALSLLSAEKYPERRDPAINALEQAIRVYEVFLKTLKALLPATRTGYFVPQVLEAELLEIEQHLMGRIVHRASPPPKVEEIEDHRTLSEQLADGYTPKPHAGIEINIPVPEGITATYEELYGKVPPGQDGEQDGYQV